MGDNDKSKEIILTDKPHPVFEVKFGGKDSHRNSITIDAVEFIDKKGYGAKGKRISTYKVAELIDISPEVEPQSQEDDTSKEQEEPKPASRKEIKSQTKNNKKEDTDSGQMSLF